jgi:hypothetical protein
MPRQIIEHERHQHAVGHGFFHTASVRLPTSGHAFDYVYDCGAKKTRELLVPRIDEYVDSFGVQEVNMLAVSHLHADHVSGLDRLLLLRAVDTVVLPYIDPFEKILLIASQITTNSSTASAASFVADPGKWFRERGVRRVLIMTPTRPTDVAAVQGDQKTEPSQPRWRLTKGPPTAEGEDPNEPKDNEQIGHDVPLILGLGTLPRWEFKFFCWRASNFWEEAKAAVASVFDMEPAEVEKSVTSEWMLTQLKSKLTRGKLTKCYRKIAAKGLNWTSLCLRSAPAQEPDWYSHEYVHGDGRARVIRESPFGEGAGWLGTGDAELSDAEVASEFVQHFSSTGRQSLASMSLAHHGSKHNHNPGVLRALNPNLVYVTCPSDSTKHPDPGVARQILKWHGRPLLRVDEKEANELHEWVRVYG